MAASCVRQAPNAPIEEEQLMNHKTRLTLAAVVAAAVMATARPAVAQTGEEARVRDAATVFGEIMTAPDKGIPRAILEKAEAVAIFPGVIRAGLGVGGQYGKGMICVRDRQTNTWSAPAFLKIAGGSFGAQIGAQSIDLVLVIMDPNGVQRLLGNQFKIGAEASVAAGPVGRSAEAATDIQLRAKILSYSRSRGLFGGIALNGSTMAADQEANQRFYGEKLGSRDLIAKTAGRQDLPAVVETLRQALSQHAG
jgi:lipid-binding SYLF domain-containing protein